MYFPIIFEKKIVRHIYNENHIKEILIKLIKRIKQFSTFVKNNLRGYISYLISHNSNIYYQNNFLKRMINGLINWSLKK